MLKSNYEEFTIGNLIRLFKEEKEEKAFDQILKRHYHLILGACYKFTQNEEDSKDLAIEICTLIWEKLKTEEVSNFGSWLYSVCKNHCMDYHRKRKTSFEGTTEQLSEELIETIPDKSFDEVLGNNYGHGSADEITELLSKLPADQRTCMRLFYLKKLSYNRISSRTGYSISQIKSSLQNGRRTLRKTVSL